MANNEFGDFQTNQALADRVVRLVSGLASRPATIVEPTCGRGSFVTAARVAFPDAVVHGLEVQEGHVRELERRFQFCPKFILHNANYFEFDWDGLFARMAKPVWVIGNPPWVTNTQLMKLESANLPKKSPQAHLRGYEAQTGKSNFDISESMIRDWFYWCSACAGTLAVICKTSVARKVLQWWWKQDHGAPASRIHLIDAQAEFGAMVSACVLVCSFDGSTKEKTCELYPSLDSPKPTSAFGLIDGHLVSDASNYRKSRHLLGKSRPQWRSGIKHDVGTVLELSSRGESLRNKLGEDIQLEDDFLFPLMKGSDLARGDRANAGRMMLVPQTFIGEETSKIRDCAPRTWAYLTRHRERFEARKSTIYAKRGPFSIFGVGEYSFRPWKIAIGALYKKLDFRLVGPSEGKPVVFDDTVYFLAFDTEAEARQTLAKLERRDVRAFLDSMIFWDDMRPIKTEILNRLDLTALSAKAAA
jgi:hypothetical protein